MNSRKKLLILFAFTAGLMALEVAGGLYSRSLALLSDAGHMLTDALAILLSYIAMVWSLKPATAKRTFGYHRMEILVSLANGLTLIAVSVYILYEAVDRFFHPEPIKTGIMLAVALAGLAGNVAGMFLLHRESEHNLNIRGAFLHLMGDALSSIGVIAGALVIAFTGWTPVDSLVGILIGGIVLRGALALVFESGEVLMEAAPRDIDPDSLRRDVEAVEGVRELHDVHVWTITSGKRALSGHVLTGNISTRESQQILCRVRKMLAEKYVITHTTLEVECEPCSNASCEFNSH